MEQPPPLLAFDIHASQTERKIFQRLTLQGWKAYIEDLPVIKTAAPEQPTKISNNETTK